MLEQEVALIVTDFNGCRLLLGALRLLGDLSVTPAVTVECVHVPLCVRDRVQQGCIFSLVVSHSSHMAWTHSRWQPSNAPPPPPPNKFWLRDFFTSNSHTHPKHRNLILLFHQQGEPDRRAIVERLCKMNFHPFSLTRCTNYRAFGKKKKMYETTQDYPLWGILGIIINKKYIVLPFLQK